MRLNKSERSLPVLLAYERDEIGNLAVWCPYCAFMEKETGIVVLIVKIGEVHL